MCNVFIDVSEVIRVSLTNSSVYKFNEETLEVLEVREHAMGPDLMWLQGNLMRILFAKGVQITVIEFTF
jgi:hypothetical protein